MKTIPYRQSTASSPRATPSSVVTSRLHDGACDPTRSLRPRAFIASRAFRSSHRARDRARARARTHPSRRDASRPRRSSHLVVIASVIVSRARHPT